MGYPADRKQNGEMAMIELALENISKSYPGNPLFSNFSLRFSAGAITCILGPSGCGKTTLLNILSGNDRIDEGHLKGFDQLSPSYIFQEPRLIPWKNVRDNILFPLKDIWDAKKGMETVDRYLEMISMKEKEKMFPSQLSGGMKQRVSLARAFCYPSDLILMDEPFKALDHKLKMNLIEAFRRVWTEDRRTVIAVIHQVEEALMLGHEIYIFSNSPVRVLKKVLIDIPIEQRNLDDPLFREWRKGILSILDQ